MASRNVDKGREAENAVAAYLSLHGFPHAERRAKRGGYVDVDCGGCGGSGNISDAPGCPDCYGAGSIPVPADAGDLTGIPGVVIQVKWSPYMPLAEAMRRTEEQRRAGRADVGLLVVKRKAVGLGRAAEWDAYLPEWAVAYLLSGSSYTEGWPGCWPHGQAVWHTDLATAAALIARAGYGVNNTLETVPC
jgi:hypothetical protein